MVLKEAAILFGLTVAGGATGHMTHRSEMAYRAEQYENKHSEDKGRSSRIPYHAGGAAIGLGIGIATLYGMARGRRPEQYAWTKYSEDDRADENISGTNPRSGPY